MNDKNYRVAIAGCGGIAQVHAQSLASMPGIDFIACADIKPDRAEAMAQKYSLKAYTDVEDMLDAEKPDCLHICTPHPLHTPLAELAAARGIAVFTEKPPVVTQEQWKRFAALADKTRVGICFQNRYNASTQRLKEILAMPEAGAVKGARAFVTWMRKPPYYTESDWRGSWTTEGGGNLINQSIHTLDLLVYLLGAAEDVRCTMHNHSLKGVIEVEDTVEAAIAFPGGVRALYYATNAYCTDAPVMVDVVCEHVTLRMETTDLTIIWDDGRIEKPVFEEPAALGKGYWGNGHYRCIQDFYDAMRENRPYQNDIASVRDTMALMLRMYDPYRDHTVD